MEQILNMIMRQLTRRFVNMGIDKGLTSVTSVSLEGKTVSTNSWRKRAVLCCLSRYFMRYY